MTSFAKIDFNKSAKFNIEDEQKRPEIYADKTAYLLSRPECFGDEWLKIPFEDQCSIVEMLIGDAVEIARDLKMGTKELSKLNSNQTKNQNENKRIIA